METSIQEQADAGIEAVYAQLNYPGRGSTEAGQLCVRAAGQSPAPIRKIRHANVDIRNGRGVLSKFSPDTNGFVLTEHETAVKVSGLNS